jgi:hypothetical protein
MWEGTMTDNSGWLSVPVGPDAHRWVTRGGCLTVLVVAHTVVAAQRLLDVVQLVESDPRVQVVYTQAPDVFGAGVGELLRRLGAVTIPWHQATHERFDLVLAAAYGGLAELHGPVLVLPHGAGYAKQTPRASGQPAERDVYGLGTEHLVCDGRVVPASIVLSHEAQLDLLVRQCPSAVGAAIVAGDPCLDRLAASVGLRQQYREALGVEDQRLIVAASTWGPHSLFERHRDLLPTLLRELDPHAYRVIALIHPAAWFGHGRRQVRAWLTDERAAGLTLVEPEVDWRAAVVAADHVIGDHGSVPVYAAAIGVPILHTDLPVGEIDEVSPQAFVGAHAPRLITGSPIERQLLEPAAPSGPDWSAAVTGRLTSRPRQAHRLLRQEMYRLLDLDVPGRHRAVEPVPVPCHCGRCRHA